MTTVVSKNRVAGWSAWRVDALLRSGLILLLARGMVGCATTQSANQPGVEHTRPSASHGPEVETGRKIDAKEAAGDQMLSVNTLMAAPPDFAETRIGGDDYPIPAYARFLKGMRICLDPGHGGDAHKRGFKRGPTGVREAEMNLRVAQYLRAFLEHAGAEVKLTREQDADLSYAARAAVANDWPADVFISCHHNAVNGNPDANYTTVWYHNQIDDRPAGLDLARHLCQGLLDEINLPTVSGVPLKTDQLMYESGFAVLRHAKVTAALCETSFFTNPAEEQRLRDPECNLQEAYGLFLGLARYALGGLPRATLVKPAEGVLSADMPRELVFELDDGLRSRMSWGHARQMIFSGSIAVRLDGNLLPHDFSNEGYRLRAPLPGDLAPGEHRVEVQFENMYKHSVLEPFFTLIVR